MSPRGTPFLETRNSNTSDPEDRDPKTSDSETRDPKISDPKEAEVQEAGIQEARVQEARIREAGIQDTDILKLNLEIMVLSKLGAAAGESASIPTLQVAPSSATPELIRNLNKIN